MTLHLGDQFFRIVHTSPLQHEHAGRTLTVEGCGPDLLRIREGRQVLAYVTRYSESECGILPAGHPTDILAPLFRTLDEALDSLELPAGNL